jgi:hypothetical protein
MINKIKLYSQHQKLFIANHLEVVNIDVNHTGNSIPAIVELIDDVYRMSPLKINQKLYIFFFIKNHLTCSRWISKSCSISG